MAALRSLLCLKKGLPNCHLARSISVSAACRQSGEKVGFIGLGNMGAHMARNLVKKGYQVVVYDINKDSMKSLVESGAQSASSPGEVAGNVPTLITMLPSSPNVVDVYTRPDGVFSHVRPNTLLIDSSTIDPAVSIEMALQADECDVSYLDAPVSGGVNAARDASLTFMVGGPQVHYPKAEAILSDMGKNVVHCGAIGAGQAAKICNNMLLGISMIGTSEAMNLGIKLGLDPKLLARVLNMSSGRCWSSEVYNPCPGVLENVPASNDYEGGFGTALMAKDLGLAQDAATANKAPTPLGSAAHQIYRIMTNMGYAQKDFGSAFKFLQETEKDE